MRTLTASVFALCLVLGMSGSSTAKDYQTLFASIANPGQSTNMSRIPSVVKNAACSKDCGANSGSANCKSNETCDCACNRKPICQCR
jgi:hypothetical protein